jgi:hypothetical protein
MATTLVKNTSPVFKIDCSTYIMIRISVARAFEVRELIKGPRSTRFSQLGAKAIVKWKLLASAKDRKDL